MSKSHFSQIPYREQRLFVLCRTNTGFVQQLLIPLLLQISSLHNAVQYPSITMGLLLALWLLSRNFWIAAIMLAIIPLLSMDIVQHYVDWKSEVREELIAVVQNLYSFDREQKAAVLDKVFERNETLTFLMYVKSFSILLLLFFSFYFFRRYKQLGRPGFFKPFLYSTVLISGFILIKIFLFNRVNTNDKIQLLTMSPNDSSF